MALYNLNSDGSSPTLSGASSRQRLINSLLVSGTSTAPVGSWTQGLGRIADVLIAKSMMADDDAKDKQATDLLLSNPMLGGSGAGDAGAAPSAPTTPLVSPAVASVASGMSPQTAPAAAPSKPNYADAISGIESGGKYDLLGPVTRTGDRAYGKYQVMGQNIPEWTKQALGTSMTPDQFLANPQAQDAVFNSKFGQYAQKYGPEGAARAWFAGEGGMNDPTRTDQLGTSVASYSKRFMDSLGQTGAAPGVQNASGMPQSVPMPQQANATLPANSAPTQGYQVPSAVPSSVSPQIPPAMSGYIRKLIANPLTRATGAQLLQQYAKPRETYTQATDAEGNIWNVNQMTGQRTVALQAGDTGRPITPQERAAYGIPEGAMVMMTSSGPKAINTGTVVNNNFDPNAGQSYDKVLTEGLAKSHAALSNGVEDAQTRARDIAAMQGAIDAIQKNGGTTGGMGQQQILDLQKSINNGANAFGLPNLFNENGISDKEFLAKFNRSMAGAMAKNAVGSRVTNFELGNFLKANPGLDMSITGNQRLLGIQAQIEQRNIAVGNAIRAATADSVSNGKRINPSQVEKIIRDYDDAHHVTDPVTGQDLTQSYTLPEFQKAGMGSNSALAVGHSANIRGIVVKRVQ